MFMTVFSAKSVVRTNLSEVNEDKQGKFSLGST